MSEDKPTISSLLSREEIKQRINEYFYLLRDIKGVTVTKSDTYEDEFIISVAIPISLKDMGSNTMYSFHVNFLSNGTVAFSKIHEDNSAFNDIKNWKKKNYPAFDNEEKNDWQSGYENIVQWMSYLSSLISKPNTL